MIAFLAVLGLLGAIVLVVAALLRDSTRRDDAWGEDWARLFPGSPLPPRDEYVIGQLERRQACRECGRWDQPDGCAACRYAIDQDMGR